jgi:3-phenylpropionate/trans-cinnamate dioxygenase ferredoxin reductase subunit
MVVTDGGTDLRYDRLLLAMGAEPRRLALPGSDLFGIQYLRTIEDADVIARAARGGQPVVVVGGGWIGAEVAASLRQLGNSVTLIASDAMPLAKVLGAQIGSVYLALHREHGVDMRMGRRVVGFRGRRVVESVLLDDDTQIDAGLVVVGAGARPRVDLAIAAGLEVADGIVVDERLRTSDSAIFAAGDVASAWHPLLRRRLRVEHWDNARQQGRAAAASMLGLDEPYARIPYFYSDQYDVSLEYVGHAPSWDQLVYRGDPAGRSFLAFWLREGAIAAGASIGMPGAIDALRALIGGRVSEKSLRDENVPLEQLVPMADKTIRDTATADAPATA